MRATKLTATGVKDWMKDLEEVTGMKYNYTFKVGLQRFLTSAIKGYSLFSYPFNTFSRAQGYKQNFTMTNNTTK